MQELSIVTSKVAQEMKVETWVPAILYALLLYPGDGEKDKKKALTELSRIEASVCITWLEFETNTPIRKFFSPQAN